MMRGGGKVKGSGQSGRQEEDQEEGVGDFEIDDEDELKESGDTAGKWSWKRVFHELVSGKDDESMSRSSRVWRNIRRYGYSSSLPLPDRGFVIHPDEWWYVLWTHFILIWAVYSSFFTPLEFGFFRGLKENLFLLDIAGQLAFLVDIAIHFFVAYKDSHSHAMVYDRYLIALRYLKSRFTVDLLGCMPWDTIYKVCGRKEPIRYMLWIRLSRAMRVTEFFEKLEKDIRINYLFTRIVKLLVVELYCTHTAACIFYYLATTMPASKEGYTWIGSLQMGDYKYSHFRDIDLWKRYITSLYFAIVTMATVGYGEIHAVNVREMIFIMIYVSFDMILGAYLLGNMTALIVKGSRTERFRDKMTDLIRYMNKNNLGKQISNEVKGHLRLQYSHKYTEATVLQDIPNSIRTKIKQKLYEPHLKKVALFQGCSPGFIKQIAVEVHEELFLPGETIIEQETAVDQLYIVCNGTLKGVRMEDDSKEEFPMHLPAYSTVGEIPIFSNTTLPYNVQACELCRLLRIDKQALTDILEMNFSDGRTILNIILEGKDSNLRKKLLESDITLLIVKHESELAMRINCAAYDGDFYRLKRLVRAGADPRVTDYNGRSPLHVAASTGHEEIASFLIEQGVALNDSDKFGNTPLLEAIKNGHDQIAALLLKAGASLAVDDAGDFLCATVARKDQDLLKRVLAYGINPNARNYDLRTPLHVAASEGLYSVARLLLESGSSVLCKDRWGNTPIDEARLCGDKNLVTLFKDAKNSQSYEIVDHSRPQGTLQTIDELITEAKSRRKCTVFPYHPRDRGDGQRKPGIILWVSQTIEELISEAKVQLDVSLDCCLLAANGGRITDPDMISNDQDLFLESTK
ncbi:hypothetical protein CDL15_Pgr019950 [Punica granatum]|uniref:Potassium channel n=1 Tax=Punica granatum TaxID=22663 RepID=A0A218VQP1_PUNGR|nr:hypothetical protein CDL15_Pgr019950 [Punica granatum]